MTSFPDDQIDPFERRLARRVGDFAEQAVRPIDAAAIAAAAHAGARRRPFGGGLFRSGASMGRLGVILAGALIGAAALAVYIGAGANNGPIANGPSATPTEAPVAPEACTAADIAGVITAWEGAAGHRIATIDIHNGGTSECLLPRYVALALIDGDGRALIVNQSVPQPAPLPFPAGTYATTLVDMANYCGQAPSQPLKIRLYLDDQSSIEVGAAANIASAIDPPPCNGQNAAAEIQMQELHLK